MKCPPLYFDEINLPSSYAMHPTIPDMNLIFGPWVRSRSNTTWCNHFSREGVGIRHFTAIGLFLDHDDSAEAEARI